MSQITQAKAHVGVIEGLSPQMSGMVWADKVRQEVTKPKKRSKIFDMESVLFLPRKVKMSAVVQQ